MSREDCARTLAAALLGAEGREILDVTGPAAVTQDAVAAWLTRLTGKAVAHVAVPPEGLHEGLRHAGLPAELARALVAFDVAAQGYHSLVTPTVERLTGSKPQSVEEFLSGKLTAAAAAA